MFPFDPLAVRDLTAELDDWRSRLDYKGPLPRSWEGRLRRDLEAEAIAASTIMEGVPVTVDEVRRVLAGDQALEIPKQHRELVEGYRDAMNFVLRRADDPSFAWNRELLIGLHDRVLGGHWSEGAGRFRDGPRFVVNNLTGDVVFTPADAPDVPRLVDEVCAQVERMDDHPAVIAAWIHVATAAIHPFADGNGRASRVLASLAMNRGGFKRREFTSLEEWWGRHLTDYYGAFLCLGKTFDGGADVTPFISAHANAQVSQVRALDLREQIERRIWTVIEDLVVELGCEPRVANAVWDAFFDREVTAGYYRALADVSPATATKDLALGVAARLLKAHGERRGRRYEAGPRLYPEVAERLGVEDAVGPNARQIIIAAMNERMSQHT
jgi:Fic family protein